MELNEYEMRLLCQLKGDEIMYRHYINILSACTSHRDVVTKVVKPMFKEGYVGKNEISKIHFYGTLTELVKQLNGSRIVNSSLYYQIIHKTPQWENEEDNAGEPDDECLSLIINIILRKGGRPIKTKTIIMEDVPDNITELLRPSVEEGHVQLKKRTLRHFNARENIEVTMVSCASCLMQYVILRLMETGAGMTVDYKSEFTSQKHVTLDKVLEMLELEDDEEQDAM